MNDANPDANVYHHANADPDPFCPKGHLLLTLPNLVQPTPQSMFPPS